MKSFVHCLNPEQNKALQKLVGSLNTQQRDIFDNVEAQGWDSSKLRVPTNEAEANELLLKGQWSVFQNIPIAQVSIVANHAVVSLEGLLDHIVAHGIPILWKQQSDGTQDNSGINGCP